MQILKTATLTVAATLILAGCNQMSPPTQTFSAWVPPLTPYPLRLEQGEVMQLFRARSTTTEIQEFQRLAAATDLASQDRAMEAVLFKLNDKELFQVGITQVGEPDHLAWGIAWCRGFTDGGRAFDDALLRVGLQAQGVHGLGHFGWYVLRERFFVGRRALLAATNLYGIELKITQPKFILR